MKKLPVCKICEKRKVKQQEWKTEEEKDVCFTCKVFFDFCEQLVNTLQVSADEKAIGRAIYIGFKKDTRTNTQRLLEAIDREKVKRVILFPTHTPKP